MDILGKFRSSKADDSRPQIERQPLALPHTSPNIHGTVVALFSIKNEKCALDQRPHGSELILQARPFLQTYRSSLTSQLGAQ